MTFEIWLFSIKKLAQTYDMAIRIFEQLSDDAKDELEQEYRDYCKSIGMNTVE